MKTPTKKQSQLCDYAKLLGSPMVAQMLRQIVYWYQPGDDNRPKLRIAKLDRTTNKMVYWISKSHLEWYEELGFSRQNTRTALATLEKMGIIESKVFRFGRKHVEFAGTNKESTRITCAPTKHIRLLIAEGDNHLTYKPTADDFVHYASLLANQSNQYDKTQSSNYKKALSTNPKGKTQPIQVVETTQSLTHNTAYTTTKSTTASTAIANTSGSHNSGTFVPTTKPEEQNQTHNHTKGKSPGDTTDWLTATDSEYDTFPELEPLPGWENS